MLLWRILFPFIRFLLSWNGNAELFQLEYLPASYVTSILLAHAFQPSDQHNSGPILSFIKAQAYFQEYVEFFLKVSLVDTNFIDTLPSVLAASVIAAARRAFGLCPTWPDKLEILAGYREDQSWVISAPSCCSTTACPSAAATKATAASLHPQ